MKFSFNSKFLVNNLEEISQSTGVSIELTRGILSKFFQATIQDDNQTQYVRSLSMKDKYYSYIIILALFIWNF
jgi:hypothetical protein